jgi:hypothetical protein
VRIVVNFASKLLYCPASVSFSSLVRLSSRCSLATESDSESGDARPFMPLEWIGEDVLVLLSLSEDVRASLRVFTTSEYGIPEDDPEDLWELRAPLVAIPMNDAGRGRSG